MGLINIMEQDSRSRKQRLKDDFDGELQRRQEIRHKYFSENHDLSDIHTNHDDAC